jgi:hypothetical protein
MLPVPTIADLVGVLYDEAEIEVELEADSAVVEISVADGTLALSVELTTAEVTD